MYNNVIYINGNSGLTDHLIPAIQQFITGLEVCTKFLTVTKEHVLEMIRAGEKGPQEFLEGVGFRLQNVKNDAGKIEDFWFMAEADTDTELLHAG